jgi:hypothetical protein
VESGTAFNVTLTALDADGNVATGYTGQVKFTDSVSGATLPADYTFTAAHAGVHWWSGVILRKHGARLGAAGGRRICSVGVGRGSVTRFPFTRQPDNPTRGHRRAVTAYGTASYGL